MNIREALETAIKYETKIRDIYRDATGMSVDDKTKRLLELLAKQEQLHLTHLRNSYARLNETGKLDNFESDQEGWANLTSPSLDSAKHKIEDSADRKKLYEILKTLLEAEQETFRFYAGLRDSLPEKQARYFNRFVENEKSHVRMILDKLKEFEKPEE